MSFQIRSSILLDVFETMKQNLLGRRKYPGYRKTERSRQAWDRVEQGAIKLQRGMIQEEMRKAELNNVSNKIRDLIAESKKQYNAALILHQKNEKTLHVLKADWSPERVLSTFESFKKICILLSNDESWSSAKRGLTRTEIGFIADAFDFIRERRILRR